MSTSPELPNRTLWHADRLSSNGNDNLRQVASINEAILVASLTDKGLHAPTLDLDYKCNLYTLNGFNVLEFGMLKNGAAENVKSFLDALKKAQLLAPIRQPIAVTDSSCFRLAVALDAPVRLLTSSSMNHYHAYIDREIEWTAYVWILDAMARCGMINPGFRKFSLRRSMTMLLVPGLVKDMLAARGVEVVDNKS